MSTRVYTLNFTGAQTIEGLPQGRFFMIKSAAAALTVECERADSQPVVFANVGAGLQYNSLDAGKWLRMKVTSQVAQTVEIVISDEAAVSFANTVNVAGAVQMIETPSAALATPARVTRATGGASTIAANPLRKRITIANPSDNATPGLLYVQAVGAGVGRGIPLDTGMFVELKTTAAIDVRNDSGASVDFTTFEET